MEGGAGQDPPAQGSSGERRSCLGSVLAAAAGRWGWTMGCRDLPGLRAPGDRLIFQVYLLLNGGALGKLGAEPPDE